MPLSSFLNVMQNQRMVVKLLFMEKAKEIEREYGPVIEEVIDHRQPRGQRRDCVGPSTVYISSLHGDVELINRINYASVCCDMSRKAPIFHHSIKSLLRMLNVYQPFPMHAPQLYALDDG